MSASTENQIRCGSLTSPGSTDCCAAGTKCDEICIAVAAAKKCRQADHNAVTGSTDDTTGSCAQQSQSASIQLVLDEKADSCCARKKLDCALATPSSCSTEKSAVRQTYTSTETRRDGCCKSETSTVVHGGCGGQFKPTDCGTDSSTTTCRAGGPKSAMSSACCKDKGDVASMTSSSQLSVATELSEACSSHLAEAQMAQRCIVYQSDAHGLAYKRRLVVGLSRARSSRDVASCVLDEEPACH